MKSLLVIAVVSSAFQVATVTTDKTVEPAKVCDVVRNPELFAGHHLLLPGIVMGKHTDHLILIYPECQFGIMLAFSPDAQRHPDVQSLFRAVGRGNPGTTDRDISGDFSGIFTYSEQGSVFLLTVEKIDHLKYPKP